MVLIDLNTQKEHIMSVMSSVELIKALIASEQKRENFEMVDFKAFADNLRDCVQAVCDEQNYILQAFSQVHFSVFGTILVQGVPVKFRLCDADECKNQYFKERDIVFLIWVQDSSGMIKSGRTNLVDLWRNANTLAESVLPDSSGFTISSCPANLFRDYNNLNVMLTQHYAPKNYAQFAERTIQTISTMGEDVYTSNVEIGDDGFLAHFTNGRDTVLIISHQNGSAAFRVESIERGSLEKAYIGSFDFYGLKETLELHLQDEPLF